METCGAKTAAMCPCMTSSPLYSLQKYPKASLTNTFIDTIHFWKLLQTEEQLILYISALIKGVFTKLN
ncbi:uncharacterized [Tachysurus ichikawai]